MHLQPFGQCKISAYWVIIFRVGGIRCVMVCHIGDDRVIYPDQLPSSLVSDPSKGPRLAGPFTKK